MFLEKNDKEKICVPTLPKIFRPITQNTHFIIWPKEASGFSLDDLKHQMENGITRVEHMICDVIVSTLWVRPF